MPSLELLDLDKFLRFELRNSSLMSPLERLTGDFGSVTNACLRSS